MSEIAWTLGPVFFHWPPNRLFYRRIADEAPIERVHIGEVVCGKRMPRHEAGFCLPNQGQSIPVKCCERAVCVPPTKETRSDTDLSPSIGVPAVRECINFDRSH